VLISIILHLSDIKGNISTASRFVILWIYKVYISRFESIYIYIYIYKTYLRTRVQIIISYTQFHSLSLSCISQFSPIFFRILWQVRLKMLHTIPGFVKLPNCKILHYVQRAYLLKCLLIRRVFGCISKTAKSDCQRRQVCMSVRPHGKTRLPLDGFSCCSIFEDFSNNRRKNWNFIKIWQE